jgi:hypothetical protein
MVNSQKPLYRLQPGEGMKGYFSILEDKLLSKAGFAPVLFNHKVRNSPSPFGRKPILTT